MKFEKFSQIKEDFVVSTPVDGVIIGHYADSYSWALLKKEEGFALRFNSDNFPVKTLEEADKLLESLKNKEGLIIKK